MTHAASAWEPDDSATFYVLGETIRIDGQAGCAIALSSRRGTQVREL
jgi:hypothetical protein